MNLPTKLTISRIVLTVLMWIALIVFWILNKTINFEVGTLGNTGINPILLGVAIIFIIASFTDFLDGYLARKNNQVTDLGKFLDPVADKLLCNSIMIIMIAPSFFVPSAVGQEITFIGWLVVLLVCRDIVTDSLRFMAAQKGVVIAANIFGKMKTVFEMIAIVLVLLNGFPFNYFDASWPYGLHIVHFMEYAATIMSLISGAIYVYQNREVFLGKK